MRTLFGAVTGEDAAEKNPAGPRISFTPLSKTSLLGRSGHTVQRTFCVFDNNHPVKQAIMPIVSFFTGAASESLIETVIRPRLARGYPAVNHRASKSRMLPWLLHLFTKLSYHTRNIPHGVKSFLPSLYNFLVVK
ncbi:MAG: hypothetical protein L7F78_00550 [Syntrophales bacterium LBB04]|nr:hypothetical protein [Syntrophales bacterium LBB04]